jgi:hypothetical protein
VAWARASLTAASVVIVKTWSLFSIMISFRPQGLRINVGYRYTFLSPQGQARPRPRFLGCRTVLPLTGTRVAGARWLSFT